ncbi:hypothetical protein ACB381_33820 [Klebsiella michiganensis]
MSYCEMFFSRAFGDRTCSSVIGIVLSGARNGCYGKSGGFDVPAVVYRRE